MKALGPILVLNNLTRAQLGVFRWLILSLLTYLLAHWVHRWSSPTVLRWKATSRLALDSLLPSLVGLKLLRQIRDQAEIAARYGIEITLKPMPKLICQDCCKI